MECMTTSIPFYGERFKGEKVTLISDVNPVAKDEEISWVVSVFKDISEIKNVSKELDLYMNMKNWLNAVIDSSYDGLWICNRNGKVIRINKASERNVGVKA